MWLELQTVSSLERCPLVRVSFIERFHCIYVSLAPPTYFLDAAGELGDASHDSPVPGVHNYTSASALYSTGGVEGEVPCLQGVVVGGVGGARLRLGLPSERAVIHLGRGGEEGGGGERRV